MIDKPFSNACENNKEPILQVIRTVFTRPCTVWEIGSGTGQHACHFARHLPHVQWQPTDRAENLPGIRKWCEEASLSNLTPPLVLDVTDAAWPCEVLDAVFTANTLHIMSWAKVQLFFARLAEYLSQDAPVCIYGPFNYGGAYTSHSNAQFDQALKDYDPLSGIRDYEEVVVLAESNGMGLVSDNAMPSNNRLLVFQNSAVLCRNLGLC
jgi:hypothetical protein